MSLYRDLCAGMIYTAAHCAVWKSTYLVHCKVFNNFIEASVDVIQKIYYLEEKHTITYLAVDSGSKTAFV